MATRDLASDLRRARFIDATPQGGIARDRVGAGNRSDFYRFRLNASRSSVAITLRKLEHNADLFLLDSRGTVIGQSTNPTKSAEIIDRPSTPRRLRLDPGTYYLRVLSRTSSTSYELKVSAVRVAGGGTNNQAQRSLTPLFADLNPGTASSDPTELTAADNRLFFVADNGQGNGRELWMSDGTAGGTMLAADVNQGANSSNPSDLVNVNNTVYFAADNGLGNGRELFRSDGATAGTQLIADINFGSGSSNPSDLVNLNGAVYFAADNGINGRELFRTTTGTNGTIGGAELVADISPGSTSSNPAELVNLNGTLYFAADNGINGRELWRSDGTSAGTTLVSDLNPAAVASNPADLVISNNLLFFTADNGTNGRELFRSNGTAAGTTLVTDLKQGLASAFPEPTLSPGVQSLSITPRRKILASVNDRLFFAADQGINLGTELYSTNGTFRGTQPVSDIYRGSTSSDPADLTSVNGRLYFVATDPQVGRQLFRSSGTFQSTQIVSNFTLTDEPAIDEITLLGSTLFFAATSADVGRELRTFASP